MLPVLLQGIAVKTKEEEESTTVIGLYCFVTVLEKHGQKEGPASLYMNSPGGCNPLSGCLTVFV